MGLTGRVGGQRGQVGLGTHPTGPSSAPKRTRSHCTHVRSSAAGFIFRIMEPASTQKKLGFLPSRYFTDDPSGQRRSTDTLLFRSEIIVWSVYVAKRHEHPHGGASGHFQGPTSTGDAATARPPSACRYWGPPVALERGSPGVASLGGLAPRPGMYVTLY